MQEKLNTLLNNSYSPYSGIKVAAIVIDNKSNEYEGVNVENASYGATICAERAAILNAISHGAEVGSFKEIHITSSLKKHLYPCAICLQFMSETFNSNTTINVWCDNKKEVNLLKDLLPKAINKGSFGWK